MGAEDQRQAVASKVQTQAAPPRSTMRALSAIVSLLKEQPEVADLLSLDMQKILHEEDLYMRYGVDFTRDPIISASEVLLPIAGKQPVLDDADELPTEPKSVTLNSEMQEQLSNDVDIPTPEVLDALPLEAILGKLATDNARYKELDETWKAHLKVIAESAHRRGASWNDIGKAVDITPQSAYQRWSDNGRARHREYQRKRTVK